MEDCRRFAPTKAVNKSQYALCTCDNIKLINMKLPAKAITHLSIVMTAPPFLSDSDAFVI